MHLLDAQLDGKAIVAGDRISFADITALCTIDFVKCYRIVLPSETGNLLAWRARVPRRQSATA